MIATPRRVLPGRPAWLPDSSGLVISAQRHDTGDTDLAEDLYFVPSDADTNQDGIRCLTAHDGTFALPSVSPDGSSVAFVGTGELETLSQNYKVGVIPISADGLVESDFTWASVGLDRSFLCMADPQAPVWESNNTLLASAEDRGDTHLFRVTANGSTAPVALTSGRITVHSYDTAAGTLVTTQSTIDHTPELYVGDDKRTSVGDPLSARLGEVHHAHIRRFRRDRLLDHAPGSGWGHLDVDDVLSILDGALDNYAFCDRTRVGVIGGFTATWLAANHTERFKGICSERAVNNLVSEEWSSDVATAFRTEHGPSHIEDVDVYASHSPIKHVRKINVPMLLIHSEEDWRCPIIQAEAL